jgi:hypothetical protein
LTALESSNKQYAIHGTASPSGGQCAFLYVNDLAVALECVTLFEMKIAGFAKQTP